ncbi:M81 family metallopeptidase [Thioclava sp.]|uniref:M81 family metallopeptidase n=1 Tax=Thioclava sp. TaxID=1933450 RepID=UPI003AA85D79
MSFRVAIIGFISENNTFTRLLTGIEDFRSSQYYFGEEVPKHYRDTGSEIGGAIDMAEARDWKADYILAAHSQPGGPVSEDTRREITEEALRRLRAGGPYDGIFVALHGAMVTETDQDGDGQFLREIRSLIGPDVPVAVTFDLHANVFDEMADLARIAVSFQTYPHIDMREAAQKSCALLDDVMADRVDARLVVRRPPVLVGCDDGRTADDGPMCRLLESAEREMKAPGILHAGINAGFTDADVWASGPSVLVTYDTKRIGAPQAETAAERLCDEIWDRRHDWNGPIPLADCIARLKILQADPAPRKGPVVVADYSDNPGSGAYSDCTALIAAMLDADIKDAAAGTLLDPEAAALLAAEGPGAEVRLSIGGKIDPTVGGGPLEITGRVITVSDGHFRYEGPMFTGLPACTGTSVCFRVQGIDIMIVSNRMQMLDQNIFRAVGIEPTEKSVLVVKSMNHFKGAFRPISSEIILTDAGGLCSPEVTRRDFRRVRRPAFPLT